MCVQQDKDSFVYFIRSLLSVLNDTLQCENWHLRLLPGTTPPQSKRINKQSQLEAPLDHQSWLMPFIQAAGFYVVVFGDDARQGQPADTEGLTELDVRINYTDKGGTHVELPVTSRDITVKCGNTARCCLDAKGRAMYVVVFNRFVRYQKDCTDEEVLLTHVAT